MVQASGEQGEMRRGMTRASSEMELVAHKKQVLLAAHGGVWDAHSSVERAVLMKAAIHSMTEAGLDEEVAQKVFELDSAAVARILEAAANCAQDASPRGDSSDALLRVAREYGLVQGEREQAVRSEGAGAAAEGAAGERQEAALQEKTAPQTPPQPDLRAPRPPGMGDERSPPVGELLITDDYLRSIHSPQSPQKSWTPEQEVAALSLKDPGSGGKLTAGRPQALVDRAGSSGGTVEDGASTAMAPVEGVGEKRGRKRGESARTGRGVDGEEKEEGTFDLVFSQLEILRLLQVVLR